jgi:hypothetical protein
MNRLVLYNCSTNVYFLGSVLRKIPPHPGEGISAEVTVEKYEKGKRKREKM